MSSLKSTIKSGIYAIVHRATGRRYVGSSVDIEKRWWYHNHRLERGSHFNLHLQRAWNKYGAPEFTFKVVELCHLEDLTAREQHHIDRWSPHKLLFNSAPAAGSTRGVKHTDITRANMRLAKADPVMRAHVGAATKKRWKNPAYRARLSANVSNGMKKAMADPMIRARMIAESKKRWKNPVYSARMKAFISARVKKAMSNPTLRAHLSETMKKVWKDPATRAHLSETMKKVWKDPAACARQSMVQKEVWSDPALRARQSAKMVKAWKRRKGQTS